MSSFYDHREDMLKLKCDGCGVVVSLYKNVTDRLWCNVWIHEHGWRTIKKDNKWLNICPECLQALIEERRTKWLQSVVGE